MDGLNSMGFEKCTPVQEFAIPVILEGKDLIACAQTGTGKTAAYLLPILNNISKEGHTGMHTLIIAPTRELVLQIDQQIEGFLLFYRSLLAGRLWWGSGSRFRPAKIRIGAGCRHHRRDSRQTALSHQHEILRFQHHPDTDSGRGRPDARHGLLRRHHADYRRTSQRETDPPFFSHNAS